MSTKFIFNLTESDATPVKDEVFTPGSEFGTNLSTVSEASAGSIKQSVSDLRKFVENRENSFDDENEYERPGSDPGLVVIFNQQKFKDVTFKMRTGTNRDVNELILTFGRLGYNVDPLHIHNDLTRNEIIEKLNALAIEDHSDRNSLIVVVLTHGDRGDMLRAKDAPIYTKEIWEPFCSINCPTLENKPKFFIFQACKGAFFSQSDDSSTIDIIPNAFYTTPWEPDMLVAFAAVEGTQSYRHMFNGTWFIQEMCRNFSAFGRRDDVVSLLIRTTKCVATNYNLVSEDRSYTAAETRTLIKMQMPLFISTLKKKFYLTKSKDRNLLLCLLKQQQQIVDTLQDVQRKVNVMYENYQGQKRQKHK